MSLSFCFHQKTDQFLLMLIPEKVKALQRQEPVTQSRRFPPLLSSPEDQDYDNSRTQPLQDSIKHTTGHTTSSSLIPSRYSTPPPPCKIKSLASATDREIEGEAQVQPSPDFCWAKPEVIPAPTCPGVLHCPTSRNKPWKAKAPPPPPHPECYTSLAPQRAVKASHPWEKKHNLPHIQKKSHPLQAQSSIMQQQALASHWKSPGLAALRGWRDAAAPPKKQAQLLIHMSYCILKSSRGKPASLLNIELSMSLKCKTPEK